MKKMLILILLIIVTGLCSVNVFGEEIDINGDINADSIVNAEDALMVLKHAAHIELIAEDVSEIADVDKNEKIDANDALCILKYAAGIISSLDGLNEEKVLVPEYIGGVIIERASGNKEDSATLLTTWDDFEEYVNALEEDCGYKNADLIKKQFKRSYFNDQNLIAVYTRKGSSGSAQMTFEGLVYHRGKYIVKTRIYNPPLPTPDEQSWYMWIPVHKSVKISGAIELDITTEDEISFSDYKSQSIKANLLGSDWSLEGEVEVISSYEKYQQFLDDVQVQIENWSEMDIYTDEFFNDNDLLVVSMLTPSGQYFDVVLDKITKFNDTYHIYLDRFLPYFATEDTACWSVLIPVSGKSWSDREIVLEYEDYFKMEMVRGVGVDYSVAYKTEITGRENSFRVLSTYEEYFEYIKLINDGIKDELFGRLPLGCEKGFFDNNSIIVAGYEEISGSIKVVCKDLTEADGKCYVHVDRLGGSRDDAMTDDMAGWEIMIPVEGKDWEDKNFELVKSDIIFED